MIQAAFRTRSLAVAALKSAIQALSPGVRAATARERVPGMVALVLFAQLVQASDVGGTVLRRMNRTEYLNTLRDLFEIRQIKLPPSFPEDTTDLRFDTMSEGMYLTPALLDGYLAVATDIADRMVLLPGAEQIRTTSNRGNIGQDPAREQYWTREDDPTGIYLNGLNIAAWSGGFWDRAFVAPASGLYQIRVKVSAEAKVGADGRPLRLGFYALNFADFLLPKRALRRDLTLVGSLDVTNSAPAYLETEIRLEKGEKFHFYCENRLAKQYPDALLRYPGFTADLRQLLKRYLLEAQASPEPTIRWEEMEVVGPIGPLPRQTAFLENREPIRDAEYVKSVLLPLARRAFRRPLTTAEQDDLTASVLEHMDSAPEPIYGIHYGIRRILTSPQFIYREAEEGALDDHGLASRLSYFLWSTSPDAALSQLADAGKLSPPATLRRQIARMVDDPKAQQFVKHFTGQWLGNRKAQSVMVCDMRHTWSELMRHGIVRATEMFFDETLKRNLSISTFIDSDFTYANEPMRIAWGVPGNEVDMRRLEADERQSLLWPEPERLDLTSLGEDYPAHVANRGGVLGLSGVHLATSDGVESSPILRGVWVLENLFGTPTPPPPPDVPALVADISKAQTVREILSAHQAVASCAVCHSRIDPIGLALENYDASGNWRTSYYEAGPVDPSAAMEDGTKLSSAGDIKQYLLAHPKLFTRTLTTKLLEYATGRTHLSSGDKRIVEQIVDNEPDEGYGFQDLLARIVQSESFQTK